MSEAHDLIVDWLPSIEAIDEAKWDERTGDLIVPEDIWPNIISAGAAFRAYLKRTGDNNANS